MTARRKRSKFYVAKIYLKIIGHVLFREVQSLTRLTIQINSFGCDSRYFIVNVNLDFLRKFVRLNAVMNAPYKFTILSLSIFSTTRFVHTQLTNSMHALLEKLRSTWNVNPRNEKQVYASTQ